MKFRKRQTVLPVPPIGELLEVSLVTQDESVNIRLQVVHMEEIQKKRKNFSDQMSWPMMCALAQGADEIHVWPKPHKAGELRVRFYPPAQEI